MRINTTAAQHAAAEWLAEDPHAAGIGGGDADHHADGAGLAGAVGSEQAENMRRRNLEREIVNGCKAAVRLSHPEQFDGRSQRLNDYTGSAQKRTAGVTPAPSVKAARRWRGRPLPTA